MTPATRLRRTRDIAAVRATRPIVSDGLFSLRAVKSDAGRARIAVSTSRAIGRAVRRNRARRRLREALRLEVVGRGGPALDVLAVARPGILIVGMGELRQRVARALERAPAR